MLFVLKSLKRGQEVWKNKRKEDNRVIHCLREANVMDMVCISRRVARGLGLGLLKLLTKLSTRKGQMEPYFICRARFGQVFGVYTSSNLVIYP